MEEKVLVANGLTKRVGNKVIVENVDITVQKGEIVGLLGPNGAGKTTIIRMLTGLISRNKGTVEIASNDLDKEFNKCMENIGAIIENPEFYKYLSGWENLKQFARMSPRRITDEVLMEVVTRVRLTEAIHQKVKTYSLGMRQRLGIAQAILHQPALLILDEPLNGLDPKGMYDFRKLIEEIAKEGTSILISSHLLSEMELLADRIMIIERGKVTHIENLAETTSSNSSVQVTIETPQQAQLQREIALMGLSIVQTAGDTLTIEIERDQIPALIEHGVQVGISFYGITPHKANLEERFLELTKGGSLK
ncbi:multidrug ABC transporter ATP-binding protein [Carnobacterium divergens]|uniref:ABC transporter ATP-binding protein n=1 Tax=Carnobacterium divergens TaxID=2748 RepID=UPI001071EFD3|nr:ABC transporter ATP-binding protein [Carnobacterium divergens]TFJ40754.1 multidrug ABC transporter ATP-binding protein [Carnobacterium divergens]TFJ49442.1 multidrug ABC transporter ATP-binding protein [Carnobacterium divergens]TFJ54809.1 multidrug ABC transporter ATP-binding protein [Carnobacterium divergens]TFJ61020.1 multidrug ABC transporter ATP-binding protein [Carnobacterium divergens]TFJ71160.1 multidrug ABC transporter ATP-binding protein [Carnobacterium divergens]